MKAICHIPSLALSLKSSLKVALNCANILAQDCHTPAEALNAAQDIGGKERFLFFGDIADYTLANDIQNRYLQAHSVLFVSDRLHRIPDQARSIVNAHAFVGHNGADLNIPELIVLMNKLSYKSIFGLGHYLSEKLPTQRYTVNNRPSKDNAIDLLQESIMGFGRGMTRDKFRHHAQRISIIADELVLNAIFHANPRMCEANRAEDFFLREDEHVSLEWGYDGRFFGLSVSDTFGNLNRSTVIKHLTGVYPKEPLEKRASGGMGLRFVFEQADQMIINLDPKVRTEMICLMRIHFPLKPASREPRSFHFFFQAKP